MRIHTNEKPFICPYPNCAKAFRQSSALKNHSNFHQRDSSFTCKQCNMNFFDKPTFNRHVREKHDLEYVYACSISGCGKHFKRKPVFKTHMQDKHEIMYNDYELSSHRVPAAPYVKAANGSRAIYHTNSSTPSKLSDALQNISLLQTNSASYGQGVYHSSSPSSYNANAVLLRDPYSKSSAAATYSPAPFNTNNSSDYVRYSHMSAAPELWLPSGGISLIPPTDTTYYNGQIVASELGADCMNLGIAFSPMAPPQRTPPNPSYIYTSGTSSGSPSGVGRAGSYSPHSSFSRASSSSPGSTGGNMYSFKPNYNGYVSPTSCY
ncbi:hypothetical protein EW145_g330 [Phellinidium pouzarii]|uniref:C2H2-type domain-containing protein n=1 Tax=Phellinidium pouzarii TaxID=167371 RepID=A0A4S4LKM3_9AGAM|nr:hypothetical protein EW145_g330 [Phellinidium pouzarii]